MASVLEVSSIAEDLLCPICLSFFQDPHILACGHNFCLSCLESCVVPKGQHQGTCPQCRDPFDFQGATRNRLLASLAEKARLLRLEEGSQSGRAGSWYFCEEHEEPLKLFCSQDEAPVCVICRDLPQHQGHSFLPIKNAVKRYQDQLKASLEPLEDSVKWATKNQSRQQEVIEELESLSEHLCGCIFVEFENLREILNEREQSMLEMVRQMKMDNQVEMEGKLEYLKAHMSSHTETISGIRAALDETNEFAFLKGVKELMGRIQDLLGSDKTESGSDEHGHGAKEGHEKHNENQTDSQGDEAIGNARKTYGEPQDSKGDLYEDIVPVDPAIGELEESLEFETWKEKLRTIGTEETFSRESACSTPPPPEEDTLPPGGSNAPEAAGEAPPASLGCNTKVGTTVPGKGSLGKKKEPPKPKKACASKQGEKGKKKKKSKGSAKKQSTHQKGSDASKVKESQNRHQTSHRGGHGHGHGFGSTTGPWNNYYYGYRDGFNYYDDYYW